MIIVLILVEIVYLEVMIFEDCEGVEWVCKICDCVYGVMVYLS